MSLFSIQDFWLLGTVSTLTALSVVMNVYLIVNRSVKKDKVSLVREGGIGVMAGLIASLFGTASCSACIFTFLGFLGFGGILFLNEYRTVIVLVATFLLIVSLYLTSKKIMGFCKTCKI